MLLIFLIFLITMRRHFLSHLLLMLSLLAVAGGLAHAAAELPDSIIIRYKSASRGLDHGPLMRRQGQQIELVRHTTSVATSSAHRWLHLQEKVTAIRQDPNVLYAEPNFHGQFEDAGVDPLAQRQGWLSTIASQPLLALGRGAGIVVAVIDSGVDLTHPDLAANLLADGYNFGDGNATPQDVAGHGTMVAGIIGAGLNNRIGVAGLAPDARILPLKINEAGKSTFTSLQLANAIDYAVSHGARILNLSLTVDSQTQLVREAIQRALDRGVFVVAAAGNQAGAVRFPANMAGVIGVAALDQADLVAAFSNSGPEITIAAPGVDIFSTMLGNGYGSASGTSYSTPMVSAVIADMLSINPALSPAMIIAQLRLHASAIAGGSHPFGRLHAGDSGTSLLPRLTAGKTRLSRQDQADIGFDLPPTGTAVNIHVSAQTPLGEFSLLPGGSWAAVAAGQYLPLARAYNNDSNIKGILFGSNGVFPAVGLSALPPGDYVLRAALTRSDNGQLIGRISESALRLD